MRVENVSRRATLGEKVREALTPFSRLKGLLGTDGLLPGEGLWICPCNSIHSFGMRYPFDVLFLGPDMKVVGMYEEFRRNRVSGVFWSARGALELPAGTIRKTGTGVGDEIAFRM